MVEDLRRMPVPTRRNLEDAAAAFFDKLKADADVARGFDPDHFDEEVALNAELSQQRMSELDDQTRTNEFDERVQHSAGRIARKAGGTLDLLDPPTRLYALQLAAAAEREQMRFMVQALTAPSLHFESTFLPAAPRHPPEIARRLQLSAPARISGQP